MGEFFHSWSNFFINYSLMKQSNANGAKNTFYKYILLQEEITYDFSLLASDSIWLDRSLHSDRE